MSTTVKSPNEKGNGFLWAVVGIVVIAAVVVGYIVINGQNSKREAMIDEVAFSTEWDGNKITLKGEGADESTPVADLYEDFSCPHCAVLAEADREDMREAVSNGELVVNIRPLVFMDREQKDGNSHRGLAAALAAVASQDDADKGLYWNLRNYIFESQNDIYSTNWDYEKYAEAAKELGASEEAVSAIREGKYEQQVEEIGAANAAELEKTESGVSSPRIFINGEEKELGSDMDWVNEYKAK
ncbi:thioredoxin domain-containing protein [Corynebacterium mastitidis]|uniref:Thioredoxin domain-containing protein n=1 Tax=Corynebacterium mastitidis TaxID=161890 RepID=A0ABU8P0J5_9CORY